LRASECIPGLRDVRHFATDAERGVLERAGIACEDHAVIAFSMKESFFKAAYPHVGRYFGFSAVSIVDADRSHRRLSLVIAQDIGGKLRQGLRVAGEYADLGDAFVSTAVAIRAPVLMEWPPFRTPAASGWRRYFGPAAVVFRTATAGNISAIVHIRLTCHSPLKPAA